MSPIDCCCENMKAEQLFEAALAGLVSRDAEPHRGPGFDAKPSQKQGRNN